MFTEPFEKAASTLDNDIYYLVIPSLKILFVGNSGLKTLTYIMIENYDENFKISRLIYR